MLLIYQEPLLFNNILAQRSIISGFKATSAKLEKNRIFFTIQKMMQRTTSLLCLLLVCAFASRDDLLLTTYDQVKNALLGGFPIRGVFKYEFCTPSMGRAIGSLDVAQFQFFNIAQLGEESIKFSASKLITNYQGKGYAWDYVKGSLFRNGTVSMFASDITTDTFDPIYEESLNCQLSDGSAYFRQLHDREYQHLQTFPQLTDALFQGKSVRAIFKYRDCEVYDGPFASGGSPDTVQVWNVDVFEYFNDKRFGLAEFFAFSGSTLIKNYQPKGTRYMYNLNEAQVFANNTVHVRVHGLGAIKFDELLNEYFECRIDSGSNQGAVRFITFDE